MFSELFASRLLEFDVEADGSLTNERTFAALSGYADGICMDAEGAAWASIGVGQDAHWQHIGAGGQVLETIPLGEGWRSIKRLFSLTPHLAWINFLSSRR